jgi:hypothetical protein
MTPRGSASRDDSRSFAVSETQPISWRSIVYGTPVISSDNEPVGKVHEVLGSDADDIFHGLRVALASGHREVMVSVDDVASMSTDEVRTDLMRSGQRVPFQGAMIPTTTTAGRSSGLVSIPSILDITEISQRHWRRCRANANLAS